MYHVAVGIYLLGLIVFIMVSLFVVCDDLIRGYRVRTILKRVCLLFVFTILWPMTISLGAWEFFTKSNSNLDEWV